MDKKQKTQRAVLLVLALLCGVCAGLLVPCSECRMRESVAAFSHAIPQVEETMVKNGDAPATDAATTLPAAVQVDENLFELTLAPQDSPAATAESPLPSSPAVDEARPTPTRGFRIEVLEGQPKAALKRVLIYHTHTYEAYEQVADERYQETEQWRTADSAYNMVRVGEELAGLLRGLGLDVVHDVTAFEPPVLSSAYARSLAMLQRRCDAGERFDLYIDLHRDAFSAAKTSGNTATIGGAELARLMLLIGKGEGQTGLGFGEKPDWQANLTIAQAITDAVNAQIAGLCKDVRLKSGRFNQHIAVGCVLVEVGNNRNTLAQALAAMPYLADAIVSVLQESALSAINPNEG
ncbi:MAG: stage II sporulation protein P [Clostridia bacterium]